MLASIFARGLIIGLSVAAPVGPIGVLCIRRTLARGRLSGFISGLGAATADACYSAIAAFGLAVIATALVRHQDAIRLVGGFFLCYLGLRFLMARATPASVNVRKTGLAGMYASTLLLTLANPTTILSFAAIFAGFGVAVAHGSGVISLALVVGVFLGSSAWWLALSLSVGLLRERLADGLLTWANRLAGVVIGGFGVAALVSVLL
ncbi:MAG TPA: LysE family transporter [Ktedonobacterales bacterium]|nr:LysE family transporter [Ktedonobacterales bacterium]